MNPTAILTREYAAEMGRFVLRPGTVGFVGESTTPFFVEFITRMGVTVQVEREDLYVEDLDLLHIENEVLQSERGAK